MTTIIAVNGLSEEEFRRAIERKLRHDKAAEAREQLRALLEPYAGPGRILPERFLSVAASDLTLTGWEGLALAVARHDEPYRRITAISIAFGWEGDSVPQPDAEGRLRPYLETSYFTDDAFPFSQSSREDLLEGYSYHGCTWTGDAEASDTALGLEGVDDLRGALAALEARLLASDEPAEDEIRAGSLGACLLSVLLFEAVAARIASDGLPRRLCVMAGSNDVYPYFDAPVVGVPEEASTADGAIDAGIPAPRYSSLLMAGVPRGRKRAVLVLEETADEAANRIALLRGHPHPEVIPFEPEPLPALTEPLEPLLPESGIIPMPGGPLMTKKPHGPGWDFRDMLSPRDPDARTGGEEPSEAADVPVDRHEPAPEEPDQPEGRIVVDPADGPAVEPGFALFDQVRDELSRLAMPLPVPQRIEPEALTPEPEPEPQHLQPAALEGPAWPLGIGWLEDAEAEQTVERTSEPAATGLWARLRRWLRR